MLSANRTHWEPIVAVVVVVPVGVLLIEVQVASVVLVLLVERRRPIVAVVAHIVDIRTVAVSSGREKDNTFAAAT